MQPWFGVGRVNELALRSLEIQQQVLRTASADAFVPPFLDLAAFTGPPPDSVAHLPEGGARVRLITVAMMRPGAKLASYRLLAAALARVGQSLGRESQVLPPINRLAEQ